MTSDPGPTRTRPQWRIRHRASDLLDADPARVYPLAGSIAQGCAVTALAMFAAAAVIAYFGGRQLADGGRTFALAFLHLPMTWISVFVFATIIGWEIASLFATSRLPALMATALAPTGALFTVLAIWTGSLGQAPTDQTWWNWTTRHSTDLTLLLLYLAMMVLHAWTDDRRLADYRRLLFVQAALIGAPLVCVALRGWHRPDASAQALGSEFASLPASMWIAAMLMSVAFWAYAVAVSLSRARVIILERERASPWVAAASVEGS